MAHEPAVPANPRRTVATSFSPNPELHDVQQYARIVQFRDAVLSGTHPTIKLPAEHVAILQTASRPHISGLSHDGLEVGAQVPSSDSQLADVNAGERALVSRKPEINPILLEKSDELIRAELQIQRQRIERALKEEVEQRRGAKFDKAEPLADFDLSEVLSKALARVQATSAPLLVDEDSAANNDAQSDSFDDNTFYSSQHDTPESNLTSRVRNDSEDAQENEQATESKSASVPPAAQQPSMAIPGLGNNVLSHDTSFRQPQPVPSVSDHKSAAPVQVPGLNNYSNGAVAVPKESHNTTSGEQSLSEDSGHVEAVYRQPNASRLDDSYVDAHPPSPLVRTHSLFPVAPQASQISSLAVERQVMPPAVGVSYTARGAPAPVAALRTAPTAVTSPESSPQTGKSSDNRKSKKKKRKADRQAPEDVVPYIKAEPRSPSPINAPTYGRPHKRLRQSEKQTRALDPDELTIVNPPPLQNQPPSYRAEAAPVGYGGTNSQVQRPASTVIVESTRPDREYLQASRVPEEAYYRQQPLHHLQRPPSAAYRSMPASQVLIDDPYADAPRYYREPYEQGRTSLRPETDAFMGQPRPQPTRIIVDSFGREYIEPPRPILRQSVAPPVQYTEPEVTYERQPARAVSRHPGPGAYDDGSVVYTRAVSTYPMPRRVVTQPEYYSQEYREDRQREYPTRPVAPAEYVQVMTPRERQPPDEGRADFISRSASVRPVDPVRYELPREYGRMHSVRPEASVREYTRDGHHEGRHEAMQLPDSVREYGQPIIHQGYSVRQIGAYGQGPARPAEEIAFIERPRAAAQEIVYADDARREMYR
jgi:hypothetical protein